MIEVGTIAGTGSTARAAGARAANAPDDGTFGESLKRSVGTHAGTPAVAPALATTEGTPLPVVAEIKAAPAKDAVTVPAVEVEGEGNDVRGLGKAAAMRNSVALATVEDAAGKKPVEMGAGAKTGAEVKPLKGDAEPGSKKGIAKNLEASAAPIGLNEVAGGAIVSAPIAVVVVPVAAQAVTAGVDAVQAKAQVTAVGVTGKGAKAGGAAKGSGREAKKVDGDVQVPAKAGAGVGTAVVGPVAGSGAGHSAGKDGTGAAAAQGIVGAAAAAPVGVAASHAGVSGVAGAKVAASVDRVTDAGGQGSAAGDQVKTLAATPNLLEVGIDGGTHGWLRVRAELGQTGEVTASVVAASAGQADTLRRELPAMSTYLAGESVGVSSLVVNATGTPAGAQDAAMSLGAETQGGGDRRAQGGAAAAQSGDSGRGGGLEGGAGLEFSGAELPATVYANGSGSWLSVRV